MIIFIAVTFASFVKIDNELMVTNMKIIVDPFWTMEKLRANGGDGRNEESCLSWRRRSQLMGSGWWKQKIIKFSPNIQFGKFEIVAHQVQGGPNEAY